MKIQAYLPFCQLSDEKRVRGFDYSFFNYLDQILSQMINIFHLRLLRHSKTRHRVLLVIFLFSKHSLLVLSRKSTYALRLEVQEPDKLSLPPQALRIRQSV